MESVQLKLSNLDKKTNALVQEGKYLEAIDVMEEALGIRKDFFGETSDEYYKTAEKLCEHYNMLSMIFLQKEKFDSTYEFLKKGEALAFSSLDLKAVTFNNLACYYRRIGKLRIALKYLEDAINIEIRLEKTKTLADTYLNICAVHSQLGRHDLAMSYVMKSILLLQDELLGYSLGTDDGETPLAAQAKMDKKDKKKQFEDRVAVLTIAYHNLGVEYEHMKQYGEAVTTYKKAVKIGRRYLDEDNLMIKNLQNIIETASQQIEDSKDKSKTKAKGQIVYGKQYSLSSTKSKPASNVPSKEGSRTDAGPAQGQGQGHLYGELEAQYKANTKPITKEKKPSQPLSGELVSASSGFASHIKPEGGNIAKLDEMVNPSSHYSEDISGENPGKSSRDSKIEVSH